MLRSALMALILFILSAGMTTAQTMQCDPMLINALERVDAHCNTIGRNQVCYGNNTLMAEFSASPSPEFAAPADLADVLNLNMLQTSPFDPITEEWGIALFSVQANLPQTLPGQSVILLALGDVTLENGVSASATVDYDTELTARTIASSNVRSGPGLDFPVIDGVVANREISVYGRNADSTWFRLVDAGHPLWISGDVIRSDDDLTTLPDVTRTDTSPMQTFRLSSGFGRPECEQVTSGVVIQSPQASEVELVINEQAIRVGSTVVLTVDAELMTLYVLDGGAVVNGLPGVPAGYAVQTDMIEPDQADSAWYGLRSLTRADIDRLAYLTNVPETILHYPITMPALITPTPTPNISAPPAPDNSAPVPINPSPSDDDDFDDNSDDSDDSESEEAEED